MDTILLRKGVLPVLVENHAEVNVEKDHKDYQDESNSNDSSVHFSFQSHCAFLDSVVVEALAFFLFHVSACLLGDLVEIEMVHLAAMG